MDEIDRQLLELLQRDGRITNAELASRVSLAPSSTLKRVEKLRAAGYIAGFHARLNPAALGYKALALLAVSLKEQNAAAVEEFLGAIAGRSEVLEIHATAGEEDFILKVLTRDMAHHEIFIRETLMRIPGIARFRTSFILSTPKADGVISVDADRAVEKGGAAARAGAAEVKGKT